MAQHIALRHSLQLLQIGPDGVFLLCQIFLWRLRILDGPCNQGSWKLCKNPPEKQDAIFCLSPRPPSCMALLSTFWTKVSCVTCLALLALCFQYPLISWYSKKHSVRSHFDLSHKTKIHLRVLGYRSWAAQFWRKMQKKLINMDLGTI